MILLIADDETLTREGIEKNLDLDSLSVRQVILADDGVHGLEAARQTPPDLILTDVRMPRMDGVEMVERIRKDDPDVAVVFMSAYSDKEYLKAAIKLKAISYVEKPLDMEELQAALKEAALNRAARLRSRSLSLHHERRQLAKLALELTEAENGQEEDVRQLIQELKLSITASTCFSTVIIRFLSPISQLSEADILRIQEPFEALLERFSIQRFYGFRGDQDMILHLYSEHRPDEEALKKLTRCLADQLKSCCHFFMARGPVVTGTGRVWTSFKRAMEILEQGFFFDLDSELPDAPLPETAAPAADVISDCCLALSNEQEEAALKAAAELRASLSPGLFTVSQVRDLYYKYLGKLDEHATAKHISLWNRLGPSPESIWDSAAACTALSQLDQLVTEKIRLYFSISREGHGEHPVVFQIKEFIHQNYPIPTLSVPDISSHVRLSPSYVCTLFKAETGHTLNQYLSEYRIRMSTQLLADPRFKITDISSKVGYSDGNYYSKAFKKMVGLSPSEYREKMLS